MNLHVCGVPYLKVPRDILELNTKISLITAIDVYRLRNPLLLKAVATANDTPYRQRKRSEILRDLLQHGILIEKATETGSRIDLLTFSPTSRRIVIPARINFQSLSFSATKVLLVLYAITMNSRTAFRVSITQRKLAPLAKVTLRSVQTSLKELASHGLIQVRKQWKTASETFLLDPATGVKLCLLGRKREWEAEHIPVYDKFKYILSDYDPKDKLKDIKSPGPQGSYQTRCPFCKGKDAQFAFYTAEDRFRCFNCRRGGNSTLLWIAFSPFIRSQKAWRQTMPEDLRKPQVVFDPLPESNADADAETATEELCTY